MGVVTNQYEEELARLVDQYNKNRDVQTKDVHWKEGVQDSSHSATYEDVHVKDKALDAELRKKIAELKGKIESQSYYDPTEEQIRRSESKHNYGVRKEEVRGISNIAKAKYDQALAAYKELNPLDRIFSGKKPIKLNTRDSKAKQNAQILKAYGDDAIMQYLEEGKFFVNIEKSKNAEIRTAQEAYKDDPETLKRAITGIEKKYADMLEKTIADYRSMLDHEIDKLSTGRGGR